METMPHLPLVSEDLCIDDTNRESRFLPYLAYVCRLRVAGNHFYSFSCHFNFKKLKNKLISSAFQNILILTTIFWYMEKLKNMTFYIHNCIYVSNKV